MKNVLVCKNCNTENPFYGAICSNCNSYLRERIFNIDLWKVIGLLIEQPSKGFSIIIQSEHKNFIFFTIFFVSIKFFIDSMFLSLFTIKPEPIFENLIRNYSIVFGETLLILFLTSIILTRVNKILGLITRIRDNFSILTFSFVPHVFALFILFIVELTVFGGNIFSKNPSPFTVKETLAFVLLGFEAFIIIWGILLTIIALYTQTKSIRYAIIVSCLFTIILYFCLYLNSIYLFK
ncbi:MAG: hypothetical protein M1480_12140 [Bacteroidetes bacterium]|nr:hypothetical protein [Bacteroidota bacterium]